jgi:endoribonuclease Dicer
MNSKMYKKSDLDISYSENDLQIDYLLLPSIAKDDTLVLDWSTICSIHPNIFKCLHNEAKIRTTESLVCECKLQNALIYTPHNGHTYITTNILDLDGNSPLELGDGHVTTYKNYYAKR